MGYFTLPFERFIDLIQRNLSKQTDKLKLKAELVFNDLKAKSTSPDVLLAQSLDKELEKLLAVQASALQLGLAPEWIHVAYTLQAMFLLPIFLQSEWIKNCGLNRLNQFAAFLAVTIRNSRQKPKLLALLRSFDDIVYSGLPLPRDEEQFAYQTGLKLRNLFGSTECGAMMLSLGGNSPSAPLLCALKNTSYAFLPHHSK
ncbi:hypothetical protein EW146_g8595 [Bondarzewia mesenterica]|uniref:Uncharacterized protein n=1 Tax=Bondarzewia mesenterica TaxID=1095465 RepID=A0A4S4LD64_9AGAM|nr:hypothetical protein EW146_g8595 [Bondarzewia mesenterica]